MPRTRITAIAATALALTAVGSTPAHAAHTINNPRPEPATALERGISEIAQAARDLSIHIDRGRELERQAAQRERTRRLQAARQQAAAPAPHLQAIAQCESGGNPKAVDASGTYYGKYQFSMQTWAGVGGSGSPAEAPEAEQDRRAVLLYARSGPGQWPVCGQ